MAARGSMGHADGIGAACEHGPHALRHDPATPRSYEKHKSYECGPLLTGIQLMRIGTTVTQVPMTDKSRKVPMTKVRKNKGTPYEGTPFRGIQVFKHRDINNTGDMFIVLFGQVKGKNRVRIINNY